MPYGDYTTNEVVAESVSVLVARTAKTIERNIKLNRVYEVESLLKKLAVQVQVLSDAGSDLRANQ